MAWCPSSMVELGGHRSTPSSEGGGDAGKLYTGSYVRFYGVEDFQNLRQEIRDEAATRPRQRFADVGWN